MSHASVYGMYMFLGADNSNCSADILSWQLQVD